MSAELEDIHEECGIFGVWGHPDASRLTYFGLHALQHRGQEGAGIVSNDNGHLIGHRGLGLLTQVFGDEREIERLEGQLRHRPRALRNGRLGHHRQHPAVHLPLP